MPRWRFYLTYGFVFLLCLLPALRDYPDCLQDPWPYLFLLAIPCALFLYGYLTRKKGVFALTATGLAEIHAGRETPFSEIERITGFPSSTRDGGCPLLFFFADRSERDISLACSDIAKLARTHLTDWTIGRDFLDIKPGAQGDSLTITYAPTGLYATVSALWLFRSGYGLSFALALLLGVKYYFSYLYMAYLALALTIPYLALEYFHRLTVTVEAGGVRVKESGAPERFLPFSSVAKIEKTWPIRVTTTGGEVFHLPRACWLLAELIEELAAPKS
ncbi:MAG: hypothetical protein P4N59_17840 [Negativicutes bacterium]|nr:hypothetical protein [Negativicutes bacterium]